jgi:Bacterial protein of unknown function (DUF839)
MLAPRQAWRHSLSAACSIVPARSKAPRASTGLPRASAASPRCTNSRRSPQTIEPTKTEPDENLYLVFDRTPGGPTPGYDYGRHFLYQGHENGGDKAYVTRINLDVADAAHRITLLTPPGTDGKTGLNRIDGSTWNPFTRTLLFTQENGASGGVVEITPGWPPIVRTLYGILGRGGYEGIHPDAAGNLYSAEDVGGTSVNSDPSNTNSPRTARQPNSFIYRFVPVNRADLAAGGQLQAMQVTINGHAVIFNDPVNGGTAAGDVFSSYQLLLHTPGTSWPVKWVTVHDTAHDGFESFDANARAKTAGATPLKRPENLTFLPGSDFKTFFLDVTGDTDADAGNRPELATRGAWGALFRVDMLDSDTGTISLFALGDKDHAAFDNLAFADQYTLVASEDRGDKLHRQLNVLDSVWAYDVRHPHLPPKRLLALGRDPASVVDASLLDAAVAGFQNDGANEPTGLHISDGSTSVGALLGARANLANFSWFLTQQHGENTVFRIMPPRR